ncbi:1,4-alpha-glucan branching protein GlgB [Kushneria indalinina]|uniref:1,4-alpha-glucan branching enzyme GlgB n=1 Tax=Kushneria indalinina DSM 14324 TaxID=1122140 RepID=A0A3D9DU67_9GAMM|nr:1,4-alpha-glucan branching protein GlgB [Kushneria indalinina]REC94221.1 1,4-alpha-glucan branching enzyme [Kushneria indalinina DSM 14324]
MTTRNKQDVLGASTDITLLNPDAAQALVEGSHGDPFAVLGPHEEDHAMVVRAFLPRAIGVELLERDSDRVLTRLQPGQVPDLFVGRLDRLAPYRLRIRWPHGEEIVEDPYAFGPLLGELDLYLIGEGNHRELGTCLGAQMMTVDGVKGVRFAVWAPNARRVSVVGEFCQWDGRRYPMRQRQPTGVWEIFIPGLPEGAVYKYEILGQDGLLPLKADPVARATQAPPETGSVVAAPLAHDWQDQTWMAERAERHAADAPISVYEVHAASWRRHGGDEGELYSWDDMAQWLIPYVKEMGFTHIELLPIMEHPFGGSWGYQPLSQFAPSGRFGKPQDFAAFVDACHQAGIGVILDWVPAHFPTDPHGLARFDGTALYEYQDPREGFHQDWNTYIYNLGRHEVHGFMLASALYWLKHFHVDALRVDAVASMLYRNYSREEGEWIPNRHGGQENLETIDFLTHLNDVVHEEAPGAIMIAEESTAWPGVSRPVSEGGLGFAYKWNMGWMHDTLNYMSEDPLYRSYHHGELTFSLVYAFSEHFMLPISHDEVVHGKGSLINKMPGDRWQQFANLRACLSLMWTHPGKKLLFMGCELAQFREWSHDRELDWFLLGHSEHQGISDLVRDLNGIYTREPALHEQDCVPEGFEWVVGDDAHNSVLAWLRWSRDGQPVLVVINLTPQEISGYGVGVPTAGHWQECFNSNAQLYGGTGTGNDGGREAEARESHGHPFTLSLHLPPLGATILKPGNVALK